MNAQLDDFLSYIASEKGLSTNTIEAYRRDLEAFSNFLVPYGINNFADVKSEHIVAFMAELNKKSYASSSLCRKLIAIKVLFRFLVRENVIVSSPAMYLRSPKLWQLQDIDYRHHNAQS